MLQRGTLKYYRLMAGLSQTRAAGLAGVARETYIKAEKGEPVSDVSAFKIVQALNSKLPPEEQIDINAAPITVA
jgi:DNA-binding XRE family transcriptional regulator